MQCIQDSYFPDEVEVQRFIKSHIFINEAFYHAYLHYEGEEKNASSSQNLTRCSVSFSLCVCIWQQFQLNLQRRNVIKFFALFYIQSCICKIKNSQHSWLPRSLSLLHGVVLLLWFSCNHSHQTPGVKRDSICRNIDRGNESYLIKFKEASNNSLENWRRVTMALLKTHDMNISEP